MLGNIDQNEAVDNMELGLKVYNVHVLGNIDQNEAVENMKLGPKVKMCKEISIRMRRCRK